MKLWRLTRAAHVALDGQGALLHGARYAPVGQPVVSLAGEAGLAVLVALRYLPRDLQGIADDYVLGWTEIAAVPERVPPGDDAAIRDFVGEWLASRRSLLVAIASKVLPEADVIYLNPRHPDAAAVPPLVTRPFSFAECLHRPPMLDRYAPPSGLRPATSPSRDDGEEPARSSPLLYNGEVASRSDDGGAAA